MIAVEDEKVVKNEDYGITMKEMPVTKDYFETEPDAKPGMGESNGN